MKSMSTRLLYIDNIRILLVTLVILVHISLTYGPVGGWYYNERSGLPSTYVLGFFVSFCLAFFMGLFFMISAYFIIPSYIKKTTSAYIKERFKRLAIPLLFYIIVIGPFLLYIQTFFIAGEKVNFFYFYYNYIIKNVVIEAGPLWFVATLLTFTLVFVAAIEIIKKIAKNNRIIISKDVKFPQNYKLFIFILLIAIAIFIPRIWFPIGSGIISLQPFPQYIFLFIFGIFAYINNWFEKITYKKAIFWFIILIITILLWPLIIFFSGAFEGANITLLAGGLHWQAFLYSLWESIICVSISISIIYFFREKLNFQNKFFKTLSESAYAVFIVHPLIIVPLSYLIRALELHPLIKFLIVAIIGVPLNFLIGSLIKRIPFLKKIL